MDEYIKREDALDAVLFALVGTGYQSTAIDAIKDVPTADVVEAVRCKDCVHYLPYKKPVEDFDGRCTACRGETDEDEFCSRGKRKE